MLGSAYAKMLSACPLDSRPPPSVGGGNTQHTFSGAFGRFGMHIPLRGAYPVNMGTQSGMEMGFADVCGMQSSMPLIRGRERC